MNNVQKTGTINTLTSLEVAGMIEKDHSKLLRDLRRYEKQFIEAKIGLNDFFQESEYKDSIGRTLPCYNITKKGCEFIAHKLTGTKGTIFTARYINRFHEMEDIICRQETKPVLPWFIRRFEGKYIMLFRDFESITGVHISGNYTSIKRTPSLVGGRDYNGWGWYTTIDMEEFKQKYGFDYGDDKVMYYLYPRGIIKALSMLKNDKETRIKEDAYKTLAEGIDAVRRTDKFYEQDYKSTTDPIKQDLPVQITVARNDEIHRIDISIV